MSLLIDSNTDCSSLSLTEIRMRVANIKARWSDEEREVRADQGRRRRQNLGELLGGQLPTELHLSHVEFGPNSDPNSDRESRDLSPVF